MQKKIPYKKWWHLKERNKCIQSGWKENEKVCYKNKRIFFLSFQWRRTEKTFREWLDKRNE